jgi:hypothetical protein
MVVGAGGLVAGLDGEMVFMRLARRYFYHHLAL